MKNLAIALLVALSAGCGNSAPASKPLPKTVPVTGTVTMNSQPLSSAMVTFYPQGTTGGVECYGTTDEAGKFKLTQLRGGEGAPPGDYKVTVSRFVDKDGKPVKVSADVAPANVGAVESLPPQYSDAQETTLTAKVPAGGGEIPLTLMGR